MKSVGEIFQEKRKQKGLSFDQVVLKTKVPKEFLIAIETNDSARLPKGLYPQLYVKRYAKFLELSEEKMAAIFRRDYLETKKEKKGSPLLRLKFIHNWQKLLAGGAIFIAFTGYLLYQYFSFVRPPSVRIQVTDLSTGGKTIKGKTNPQASLKIEGEIVALDEKGNFVYQIGDEEKKEIIIVVESPAGKIRRVVQEL